MYIRTKDWIYDTDNLHYRFIENNKVYEVGWDVEKPTFVADIIKQSENLEELCDLFIDEETKTIFHKHNGYVINWKTNMVYSLKALSESYHSIKGAIYTDKGLIYVAKIDNEGKLELK